MHRKIYLQLLYNRFVCIYSAVILVFHHCLNNANNIINNNNNLKLAVIYL